MGKPRNKSTAKAAAESGLLAIIPDVWKLHLQRTPEREIVAKLGIPKTTVHRAIERGRQIFRAAISAEDNQDRVDERRAGLVAILDEAWASYRSTADLAALELARKTEADLRKMFGDDAPQQIESKSLGGVVILSREEMYAEVQKSIQRIEGKKNHGSSGDGTDGSCEAL